MYILATFSRVQFFEEFSDAQNEFDDCSNLKLIAKRTEDIWFETAFKIYIGRI